MRRSICMHAAASEHTAWTVIYSACRLLRGKSCSHILGSNNVCSAPLTHQKQNTWSTFPTPQVINVHVRPTARHACRTKIALRDRRSFSTTVCTISNPHARDTRNFSSPIESMSYPMYGLTSKTGVPKMHTVRRRNVKDGKHGSELMLAIRG